MSYKQWQDMSSNTKNNKSEAFYFNSKLKYEQMSKQQQLIEQKKMEIQKRMEDKKKKETEEALKKLNDGKQKSDSKSKRNYYGSYSKKQHLTAREKAPDIEQALPANIFSNDGSFLQQFQKISGIKVEIRKKSSRHSKTSENSSTDVKIEAENKESVEVDTPNIIKEEEEQQPEVTNLPSEVYQPETIVTTVTQLAPPQIQQPQQTMHQGHQVIQQQIMPNQQQHMMPNQQQQMMPNQQQHMMPNQQQHMMPNQQQQMVPNQQQQMVPNQQEQMMPNQQQHMMPNQQQQMMPNPPMQPFVNHQPPLHQQVFTPQQMPMNFPPQFNPMQCGMMLPPPMAPSSIPPPAPLNPGSIPSPSPLQPCSIPSPSPLQPYAIPPPSPLLPHSIPPPSPMIPHSIPPPSPLTPHSIPPPLPLRPQSIPPPLQQPPLFLTMVPPPPPPPPEEEKPKSEKNEIERTSPPPTKPSVRKVNTKMSVEDNVKDLFKNDEYSSSSDEEETEQVYGPSNRKRASSDSESECERKYPQSNSERDSSDNESDRKIQSISDSESEKSRESQPPHETELKPAVDNSPTFGPILIEDTQTQFPSEAKDSSYSEEAAPPDLSSEGETHPRSSDLDQISSCDLPQSEEVKQEPEDMFVDNLDEYTPQAANTNNQSEVAVKQELQTEIKEEKIKYTNFVQGKQEILGEETTEESAVKSEHPPPPKKKRKSRWATNDEVVAPPPLPPNINIPLPIHLPPATVGPIGVVVPKVLGAVNLVVPPLPPTVPIVNVPGMSGPMLSKVGRSDPALVAYAMKSYGHTNLSDPEWKKVEDHYKINLLYQDMMRKREELQRLEAAGRNKYEYDSDEDTEGGTWEHKVRSAEMEATQLWADELTEQAKGKHHIGDFLPPDELARFMEKYEALKDGREPDLSDYKEFKLKEDNVGYQMLQKLGWTEGQGLGPDGSGIMDPVNKAMMRAENQGLGIERPDDVEADDDEYDAYRKRMMLAYRFRPNPMNNPRRPYY